MKLYACPGTCSLAPHIALHELGIPHELEVLNLRKGDGNTPEFLELSPMGQVPVLVGEHGEVITEVAAILVFLFQQHGKMDVPIYQTVRHLSFIASELHKNFYPQFFCEVILGKEDPSLDKLKDFFKERTDKRWEYVDHLLPAFDDLDGADMGAADPYLYTVCRWWIALGHNFKDYESLPGFIENMENRESVKKALEIEGLDPIAPKAVAV